MDDNVHMLLEDAVAEMIVKQDPKYTENTYGTTNMENQCYMSSLKKLDMELYKQHYCSGNYYQRHYRSGVSHWTHTTNV